MNYLKKLRLLATIICLLPLFSANAVIVKEHIINSKTLGEKQNVTVYLPDNYGDFPDYKYPVYYFLDGKYYKDMIQGVISSYYENGLAPHMILIAIENESRIRDYTPTEHVEYKQGGGADAFLDYIEKELLPFVDKHYQTSDFKTLSGHSLGGLLSLHAMHSRPGLFTAHVALSPSIHWGNEVTLPKLKRYLSSEEDLNQFLYVNLGDEGFHVIDDSAIAMREGFLELKAFLEETIPNGLRFKIEHLQTLPHVATLMTGLVNSTNELYRNWSVPFRVFTEGPEGFDKHFKLLSQDLFQEIKPRKGAINFASYYMTGLESPEKGMELLQYNAGLYSDSAWVLFNLAKGYKERGDQDKAKQQAMLALGKIKSHEENLKTSIDEFIAGFDTEE